MKIFLTGATGFIGKNLLKSLVRENHEVLALCRQKGNAEELEKMGAKVLQKDLQDIKKQDLEDIDAIIHLAAIRYEWGHLAEDYAKVNVEATRNLLDMAEQANVKKFIYGSSVFVFGYPRQLPIDETFPYAPTTNYARSKVGAEKLVQEYSARYNFPAIIIRPTITYGPGDTKGMLLKLAKLIKSKKFAIIGNGQNLLHLTHIDDVIQGFKKALQPETKSNDFIIASKTTISQENLAGLIAKELDLKIWPIKIPRWIANFAGYASELVYKSGMKLGMKYFFREPFISRSKVDIVARSQKYEIAKAQKILGFDPKIDCPEGVRETICWYKQNGYL